MNATALWGRGKNYYAKYANIVWKVKRLRAIRSRQLTIQ